MSHMSNKLHSYLVDNFTDRTFGGLSSAIDYDASRTLTTDQQLDTASLALFLNTVLGNPEDSFTELDRFVDPEGGYHEFIERTGRPHELAAVKTADRQYLTAVCLLLAANEGRGTIPAGLNQLRFADDTFYRDGTMVETVSSSDSRVIDSRSKSDSLALRVWAHSLAPDNEKHRIVIENGVSELISRIGTNGVLADWYNENGTLEHNARLRLRSSSMAALALTSVSKKVKLDISHDEMMSDAAKLLEKATKSLWDNRFGGHWEHCGLDGRVTVHRDFITLLNSAVPIKTTESNCWFLMACQKLLKQDPFPEQTTIAQWRDRTVNYLETMIDDRHGGVFSGEGFFWTPPGTPVGPFVREVLPSRDTPGVFSFGATPYRRLYNKESRTQTLASLALHGVRFAKVGPVLTAESAQPRREHTDRSDVTLVKVDISTPLQQSITSIDSEKHISSIERSYTPGLGYGWTPHISPLGTVPNSAPSVFAIHHSTANLLVLGRKPSGTGELVHWIQQSLTNSGAYADYPGGPFDVLNTYLAVNALEMLGQMFSGPEVPLIVDYLQSTQNKDGGFGVVPGFPSDLFHTNLAVVALNSLGGVPSSVNSVVDYVLQSRNGDGGYGERIGTPSDTYSVYRAIGTFSVLGHELPRAEETVTFLESCYTNSGGYSNEPDGPASLIATYHAVASRYLLDSPSHAEETRNWLTCCQTEEGTFSNVPEVRAGTIDEGFAAVQSLAILDELLDRYFVVAVS